MKSDLRKLHHDVAFGKSGGKIIWQPRISCWYTDKLFAGENIPAPYTGMDIYDIYRRLGVSARLYERFGSCFKMFEHQDVRRLERKLNDTDTETTIETPVGKQIAINRSTKTSSRSIRLKWEISNEEEMKVAIWRIEHTTWKWDQALYDKLVGELGDLGAPTVYLPRVNIQDLYLNKMGIEQAVYALHDYPATVEAYFKALDDCHECLISIVNSSPIDIINFGDNLHCGTLPVDLFKKYVLTSYQRRCASLHRAGKFISSHWDGDTKALLPFAKETGLDAIEAITPQPQGDVTLEEIKAALGDVLFLLDGIPAILFNDYHSVAELESYAKRIIDLFAPKLILGISDELSSTGQIERIGVISDLVDRYNSHY